MDNFFNDKMMLFWMSLALFFVSLFSVGQPVSCQECISYKVSMVMSNTNEVISVDLIRDDGWIKDNGVRLNENVIVEINEIGVKGRALVNGLRKVNVCIPNEGSGLNLVTGKISRTSPEGYKVVEIKLEGDDKPVLSTLKHPYWSVDRNEFVEARYLNLGENVDTVKGVKRIEFVGHTQRYYGTVYNLETTNHVYRVGQWGILVHNSCTEIALGLALRKNGENIFTLRKFSSHLEKKLNREIEDFVSVFDRLTPDPGRNTKERSKKFISSDWGLIRNAIDYSEKIHFLLMTLI